MQNSIVEVELLLLLVEKICVVIVVAYLITRTKHFHNVIDKQPTFGDRLILILAFGGFSIYGTYSGIKIFGAIANTRDLGPMIAGLVGGPFIGLGAGLIGGIHRYFLGGGFTAIPCTLATIISGLLGGLIYELRKKEFVGILWAALFAIF
ncbi:stage II sporulation protein E, partial [Candidatus Aerophobetes bacterium]|nr:stage II sporulation protein E [Candidatus Aerophobetes bacterium]